MKRIYFLLMVLLVLIYCACDVFAFQGEPKDFRGIAWGTNINELSGMINIRYFDGGSMNCERKNDPLRIGNADIKEITYAFYNNMFGALVIRFDGYNNFIELKTVLFNNYGPGDADTERLSFPSFKWSGENIIITIDCDKKSGRGTLIYNYKPLAKKRDGL